MDETSVCLFQGVGKGVCRLCRQKSRATKAFSFRACYRLWTLSTQRMLQSQRHVRSEELRAPLFLGALRECPGAPDGRVVDFLYPYKKALLSFLCFCQRNPSTALHARFGNHGCAKLRVEPTLQAARPILSKGPRLILVRSPPAIFCNIGFVFGAVFWGRNSPPDLQILIPNLSARFGSQNGNQI